MNSKKGFVLTAMKNRIKYMLSIIYGLLGQFINPFGIRHLPSAGWRIPNCGWLSFNSSQRALNPTFSVAK